MLKSKTSYSFFSSFVIRTPAYSIGFYKNLTNGFVVEFDQIKEVLKDAHVNEALFLASPELYSEIQKWITIDDYPDNKAKKIKLSVLKYLIRMSTRCTPFGLFAACGAGKLGNKTVLNIHEESSFYRRTRFDMQFLANLVSKISANSTIQNQLLFYPNTTLYQLSDFYRYVEYTLFQNKRKYSLEALKRTDYLDLVLQKAMNGVSKDRLTSALVSEEITKNEASSFIDELIANQVLVSELEPTLTGNPSLNPFTKKDDFVNENKEITTFGDFFDKLDHQLLEIDSKLGNPISSYNDIINTVTKTNVPFDKKYLFQTDLFLDSKDYQLDKKYSYELSRAITLLNKVSEKPKNTDFKNFKKAFVERYENESVPLVKALDVETGIGYLQYNDNSDVTPLLDRIKIKGEINTDNHQVSLNKTERIIYKKLHNALQNNENRIELNYSDFENIDFSKEGLPDTFSCLFEIVEEEGKEWLAIQSIGGSCAANLLARFCYGNPEINDLADEITLYESENCDNKIVAEIIHLPESRTGNVLRRPNFRSYEIPYLGQSSLPNSQQINIEDLILFVKNDRLVLWSKKNKKEVIPKLTNAHNYSYNALPIYHFLCDMQFENCKHSLGFQMNNLEKLFDYFPRMSIGNCIVLKAKWIFKKELNFDFFGTITNLSNAVEQIEVWRMIHNLPQYVSLVDGDNTLVINLKNTICIEMLIETVKNRPQFVLEEFLFPSSNIVTGKTGCYANQFIVGLKKDKL